MMKQKMPLKKLQDMLEKTNNDDGASAKLKEFMGKRKAKRGVMQNAHSEALTLMKKSNKPFNPQKP